MAHCANSSSEPVLAAIGAKIGVPDVIRMENRYFAVVGLSDEVRTEDFRRLCAEASLKFSESRVKTIY
jgi:hypothetical protein